MAIHFTFSSFLPFLAILNIIFITQAETNNGLSIEVIHRDSPQSPHYNPLETHSQRLANSLRRSIKRANYLFSYSSKNKNSPQSDISPYIERGEYLMKIAMGTPPLENFAYVDTGSDLLWIQCQNCTRCYKQKSPIFEPKNSKTFKNVFCNSKTCKNIEDASCLGKKCVYKISYGDGSLSNGDIAIDKLTLSSTSGSPVAFPQIIFGCAHSSYGTAFGDATSGIVGLGSSKVSLITQLGPTADGKFSYCLPPLSSRSGTSSKISFGDKAVIHGAGVLSTPIVTKDTTTFYHLTLEGISVGSKRIYAVNKQYRPKGNVFIDSGTTLTYLPHKFYKNIENELVKTIKNKRVKDPQDILSLCYEVKGKFNAPVITAHFANADVPLSTPNTFIEVADGVWCFAFTSNNPGDMYGGVFGNIAQSNYIISYDLKKKTLSFLPKDCTK